LSTPAAWFNVPAVCGYPTAQKIWDVLLELHSQEQVITRELLRDLTGLRLQIVDDHVGPHD